MVSSDNGINGWSPDNTMRVLIASDIHLGFSENDPVRGEDSFTAFEEVLSLAVEYDVDFILLGGDLFHHAKPSPSCMYKCNQIIRKYCFGDKPVNIELLSDQLKNFNQNVNYEDPNLNIAYPILSIHGNHDDPVGQGSISSLDILSITGLVNYFGKWTDYSHVRISPVLMQKGSTKLALYGLSHLKDQRLSHLFAEKKVEIECVDDGNEWFNLMVLHQNRADRGPGNYISEDVLPKFLDVVVWGHEHDSQVFDIKREKGSEGFFVLQPGSTVATSLAAGEALPKHCALLQIHQKESIITALPLKTVRPFIFKTVVLSEEHLGEEQVNEHEKVQEYIKNKVNEAIEDANKLRSGDNRQPTLPLVRLSIFYERESQNFNKIRFGQHFNGLVANPNDILVLKKEKITREKKERDIKEEMVFETSAVIEAPDVESLLKTHYESLPPDQRLNVLSIRSLTDAVRDFTMKKDNEIFKHVFEAHKKKFVDFLMESNAEREDEIKTGIKQYKETLDNTEDEQLKTLIKSVVLTKPQLTVVLNKASGNKAAATPAKRGKGAKASVVVLSSDEEDNEPIVEPAKGRGRPKASPRGRGRGRKTASPPPTPTTERRTSRRAAQKTNSWLQSLSSSRQGGLSIEDDSD